MDARRNWQDLPDAEGRFGIYGGRFVAETLMPLILDLEAAYRAAQADPAFQAKIDEFQRDYVGRPSPLYFAERLTEHFAKTAEAEGLGGAAKIYFKRDELNHTGAHKINNCLGQILLALRMGKTRIIAETGAGQHGVATATVAARFGLPCIVFMGATDIERQKPNVFRMKLLGAEVRPVTAGAATLKDAMNEALRDWVTNVDDTFYCIGTAAGPHPYPEMVRDFQSVIGREARAQMLEREGRLPDAVMACIGGGSNAIGLFHPFIADEDVKLYGVEAAGRGIDDRFEHSAAINGGRPGVLHGNRTYLLQNADGQILEGHSISAGLIAYVMAYDPDLATSYEILRGLPASGADVIELGFPFSDPMADGVSIQKAAQRALAAGGALQGVLDLAARFRKENRTTPLVLMGYANPVEQYGHVRFADAAAKAGIDGAIVVDLPPEEDRDLRGALAAKDISIIRLATPTTDDKRLPRVLDGVSGFLYYVSVAGVTGAKAAVADQVRAAVTRLKRATPLPVAVGFGVREPYAARAIAQVADAVVIGSAFVDEIVAGPPQDAAARVLAKVKTLSDAVRTARNQARELEGHLA